MNFFSWFANVEHAYQATVLLLSVGLLIAALEDLHTFPVFQGEGLLSWRISRLIGKSYCQGTCAKIMHFWLNDLSLKIGIWVRLFGSMALLVLSAFNLHSPLLLSLLFLGTLQMYMRSPYSLDGAHQMHLVVLLGTSLGTLFGSFPWVKELCLGFIAAQLTCSYAISGITKLCSPVWVKSSAIYAVFSTQIYGHAGVYQWLTRYPALARIACWSVMLFEALFPLAFFLPPLGGMGFLAAGLGFHLANALFMGLNDFLFAFIAAYPSLLYFLLQIGRS